MAESHCIYDVNLMKSMIDNGRIIHDDDVEHHKIVKNRIELKLQSSTYCV